MARLDQDNRSRFLSNYQYKRVTELYSTRNVSAVAGHVWVQMLVTILYLVDRHFLRNVEPFYPFYLHGHLDRHLHITSCALFRKCRLWLRPVWDYSHHMPPLPIPKIRHTAPGYAPLIPNHHKKPFLPGTRQLKSRLRVWSCRNFSGESDSSGRNPSTLIAMVGLTNRLGWPVTGCLMTNGRVVEPASLSPQSVPTRATSLTDAEVWKRRTLRTVLRKAGERAT